MKCYRIGRDPDINDIVIGDSTETMSRQHAELTVARDGRLFYADTGSANGSFRADGDHWVPLERDYVGNHETLKLGEYKISVTALRGLVPMQPDQTPRPPDPPPLTQAPEPSAESGVDDPHVIKGPVTWDDEGGGYTGGTKGSGK